MSEPKTIRVRAPKGRTVPLHPEDHRESSGHFLLESEKEVTVFHTMAIRRRIRAGDLEIVPETAPAPDAAPPETAPAPIVAPVAVTPAPTPAKES